MLSEQVENYLKGIYDLQSQRGKVSTSLLSERLRVSSASVTEMIQRLAEEHMVNYTPYKGVALTEEGQRQALRIIRKHRLWELFLVEVLKFNWDEIHDEAERLEHMMSDRLEERIDAVLGHPQFDPHGHMIPSSDGKITSKWHPSLADVQAGSVVTVARVSDSNPEVLQYLSKMGIGISTAIEVKERISFDGSLRVRVGGSDLFISEKLAQHVSVALESEEEGGNKIDG
jgi:DtxR family transcriptional regulator, Mn-dependent transcriptional regulator